LSRDVDDVITVCHKLVPGLVLMRCHIRISRQNRSGTLSERKTLNQHICREKSWTHPVYQSIVIQMLNFRLEPFFR